MIRLYFKEQFLMNFAYVMLRLTKRLSWYHLFNKHYTTIYWGILAGASE
jgi:hypothetical protein